MACNRISNGKRRLFILIIKSIIDIYNLFDQMKLIIMNGIHTFFFCTLGVLYIEPIINLHHIHTDLYTFTQLQKNGT